MDGKKTAIVFGILMIMCLGLFNAIFFAWQAEQNSKPTPVKVIHIPVKQYPPPREVIVPIDIRIKKTIVQRETGIEKWDRQSALDRANQLVKDQGGRK